MARKQKAGRTRGTIKAGRRAGTYTVRVFLGRIDGKRKYSAVLVDGTISQAKLKLTQMLAEIDKDEFIAPSGQTVQEYVDGWLTNSASTQVSPRTLTAYRYMMVRYVYPFIGHRRLDALHPSHVQALITDMAGRRKLGYRIIQYTHTVLKSALTQAVKWRQIKWNPADDVQLPPNSGQKATRILTADQVNTLLDSTRGTAWHAFWTVMLHTGMRPQECAALTWADISTTGSISISKALVEVTPGHYEIGPCKTAKSYRTIVVGQSCVAALADHRTAHLARVMKAGPGYNRAADLVFATRDGGPLCLHNVYRAFQAALKSLGLPAITLYQCRHTHISLLLGHGVPVKDVSDRAGHASAKMTLDRYAKVLPQSGTLTAAVFERLLTETQPDAVQNQQQQAVTR